MYTLLISNLPDTVASMLQVMVALLGPQHGYLRPDILLRCDRYDGRDLSDETRPARSGTPSAFTELAPPP